MRGETRPLDEYGEALLLASLRCEPIYSFNGMVGFDYASIKDSIRDVGLNVREHRVQVSMIGKYMSMDIKDLRKKMRGTVETMSVDEINEMLGV